MLALSCSSEGGAVLLGDHHLITKRLGVEFFELDKLFLLLPICRTLHQFYTNITEVFSCEEVQRYFHAPGESSALLFIK